MLSLKSVCILLLPAAFACSVIASEPNGQTRLKANISDIVAFANNPFRFYTSRDLLLSLSKETLDDFIKRGQLLRMPAEVADKKLLLLAPITLPQSVRTDQGGAIDEILSDGFQLQQRLKCEGVAVTSQGCIYFWNLLNDRVLFIQEQTGNSFFLVSPMSIQPKNVSLPFPEKVKAPSLLPTVLKSPPRVSDIKYITNMALPLSYLYSRPVLPRMKVDKSVIYRFLQKGDYITDRESFFHEYMYLNKSRLTLTTIEAKYLKAIGFDSKTGYPENVNPAGVLVTTQGEIYFWRMLNDVTLEIRNEAQQTGFFILHASSRS